MAVRVPRFVVLTLYFVCLFKLSSLQNETTTTPVPEQLQNTQSTPLERNTDFGQCTCDLTVNSCDVNCCCDTTDCSEDDVEAFSRCIDEYTGADSQTCVRRSMILIDNTPFEKNETVPGLFCVQVDNYEDRNYYEIPDVVNDTATFEDYRQTYGGYSFQQDSTQREINKDFYKLRCRQRTGFYNGEDVSLAGTVEAYRSGDPVYTVFEGELLGLLGLPAALNTGVCNDNNPAAFLYSQTFGCIRRISNISECQTNYALDGNSFFMGFRVVKTPSVFQTPAENDTAPAPDTTTAPPSETTSLGSEEGGGDGLYNSSSVLDILPAPPHTCIDIDGRNTTCDFTDTIPSPEYKTDGSQFYCENAIVRVEYIIEHNSTMGITDVGIRVTVADITEGNLPLNQEFVTTFKKLGEGDTFRRSGNPGYRVGEPLLAGRLTQWEDPEPEIGTRLAIDLDSDRSKWLTMVTSSATGSCIQEPNNRVSVMFGEDMRSGCYIRVTLNNITNACALIQDAVKEALLGPYPPEYVATFGNSAVEKVGDWVPILRENEPSGAADGVSGVCPSVVLGMHIEVLYASVGALGNPQPKVIGVVYRFDDPQEIRFQCIGPYCQPGTETSLSQTFEVVSSVGFVDATQAAQGVDAEPPKFTAKLPEDFFYPFT